MTAGLSDVLGWTLIHFLWQGTAIAAVLGLALLLIPRPFARARYAAGLLALALMLFVPVVTGLQLAASPREAPVGVSSPAPGIALQDGRAVQDRTWFAPRSEGLSREDSTILHLLPWIVTAWSVGVLFFSLRLAGGWWQARRLVRIGTRPAPEHWHRAKDVLAARLRLARAVELLESTRVQVPVVIGWLRPVLLVPPAVLAGLTPQQLEAVLAHELAHIRRHDYVLNLMQTAVETLLFYHPAVWWVSRTVRIEREHCCDDLAVVACGDPVLYARALTAVESLRPARATGAALAVTGSPLMARVRRLLGMPQPASVSSSGWVVATLTALMVAGAGTTSLFRDLPPDLGSADGTTAEAAALLPPAQEPNAPAPAPPPSDDTERRDRERLAQEERQREQQERAQLARQQRELEQRERTRQARQQRELEQQERARQRRQERALEQKERAAREERERQRAVAHAREAMREVQASVRAALREHRDELRAARLEGLQEVQASVRRALEENREALEGARRALRESHPELEASVRELVQNAAKLSRDVAEQVRVEIDAEMREAMRDAAEVSRRAAEEMRPEIEAEMERLAKDIAAVSGEAAREAAELAAEIAREVAREIERAVREREAGRGTPGDRDTPSDPPPAPPATPVPPATEPPPVPPADAPAPPRPPQSSWRGRMPVAPDGGWPLVAATPSTPATPLVPVVPVTQETPPVPAVAASPPAPPVAVR